MKSGGLPRTIDPGLRGSAGDLRPGRPELVSPHLVLLLRGVAHVDASAPVEAEMASSHDDFDAARGIILAAILGMSLWVVIGGVVWSFVR